MPVVSTQVILDGQHTTVIKVTIKGDAGGELTNAVIFDASAYTPATTNNRLRGIKYLFNGFSGTLFWDATTPVILIELDDSLQEEIDFTDVDGRYGGIPNNGGVGRTGDILLSTTGLDNGEIGYLILYVTKKDVPKIR
jgi:hypothetical protein